MKKVTVKALKPFYWGQFANIMKKPNSEPFEVTEYEYNQLKAKGMVELVEDAPAQEAEPAPSEPEPEKPKTTRSKTSK